MITLSSDFGSPYPAAMKGVICQRTDARLVDISHEFPRQDVRATAFWLTQVLPYMPPATHLVVVDPGVGTDRDVLVARAGEHALVGPDNGVLRPAARSLAPEREIEWFRLAVPEDGQPTDPGTDWPPVPASSTFHGRDVFAPVAARVHELGVDAIADEPTFEPVDSDQSLLELEFPEPTLESTSATGEVLVADEFGNAITNIPGSVIAPLLGNAIVVNGESFPVREMYAAVDSGEPLVTVGSHEQVELAVNQGRGTETFDLAVGDTVSLSW